MQVGLTGGIGSGKSTVAAFLQELGAFIIDSDELARDAVAPGGDGLAAIARLWPDVVHGDVLDRAALARIVFTDEDARSRLNAIVHPIVRRLAKERETHAEPGQLIVQSIPLLFETNADKLFEKNVVVVAPDETRIARVLERDGSDAAHVRARMGAQIPVQQARERASFVIENDGDLARLREQTQHLYTLLTGD